MGTNRYSHEQLGWWSTLDGCVYVRESRLGGTHLMKTPGDPYGLGTIRTPGTNRVDDATLALNQADSRNCPSAYRDGSIRP